MWKASSKRRAPIPTDNFVDLLHPSAQFKNSLQDARSRPPRISRLPSSVIQRCRLAFVCDIWEHCIKPMRFKQTEAHPSKRAKFQRRRRQWGPAHARDHPQPPFGGFFCGRRQREPERGDISLAWKPRIPTTSAAFTSIASVSPSESH